MPARDAPAIGDSVALSLWIAYDLVSKEEGQTANSRSPEELAKAVRAVFDILIPEARH
jgi:hypothetical protein